MVLGSGPLFLIHSIRSHQVFHRVGGPIAIAFGAAILNSAPSHLPVICHQEEPLPGTDCQMKNAAFHDQMFH